MNYVTFQNKVAHNTIVLKEALNSNKSRMSVLSQLHTWDTGPGELHDNIIMSKAFDILPAAYLGLLANTKQNGFDAFAVLPNNNIINYELKTACRKGSEAWKTKEGTLYFGARTTKNDKVSIRSAFNASYSLQTFKNIQTKRVKTILMVSDLDDNSINYFDAYELDGNTIISYLTRTNCKNRTIKFGTFYNNGHRSETVVELEGFQNWENKIRENAPIKKIGVP